MLILSIGLGVVELLSAFILGILMYIASLKLSRVAGWVVGKTDFNENPVVSLDLDFGL